MITIIAAVSADGVIGKHGKLPWRLKGDMDHFRQVTTSHTVIMGRRTWDSIDERFRPLRDRRNIVISRNLSYTSGDVEVVHSIPDALTLTEDDKEVFIIGGAQVYRQTLPLAERLLLTRVHVVVEGGDALFPVVDPEQWNLVSSTKEKRGENDEFDFTIDDYSPNLRYIELANVRTIEQLKEYRVIRQRGHCPFCQENLSLYHNNPILHEGGYWLLTTSDYPYPGTDAHFLFILKEHAERFQDLPPNAYLELFKIIGDLEAAGSFAGGGLCARAGDPLLSGASVKHIHFHLIAPTKGAPSTQFYMGKGQR